MLNTRLARLPTLAVFARRAYSGYPGTVRLPTLALFARRTYADYPGTVAQSSGFGLVAILCLILSFIKLIPAAARRRRPMRVSLPSPS